MQVKTCQLCEKLSSVLYTCQLCKRKVCEACFEQEVNLCSHCHSNLKVETLQPTLPTKLFFLGFALILIGTILIIAFSIIDVKLQPTIGTIILIGPIPIIIGTGPHSIFAILLATILTIIGIVFFLLLRK